MHKRFCFHDQTTTRLYITGHIQFDEALFPTVPRSFSSFHISNFLESHLYHNDPPTPSSLHIPRSSSCPCDICYGLVAVSVQIYTSLVGSSLPPLVLIRPLLNMRLIPHLLWALILQSHEQKLIFSKLVIQQFFMFWAHLDFFLLFLHSLNHENSNLLLRIVFGLLPWMRKFELYNK